MTTTIDHGPLSYLPPPERGHITDGHVRILTFWAATPHQALRAAAEYILAFCLDPYVVDVSFQITGIDTDEDSTGDAFSVVVIVEAGEV